MLIKQNKDKQNKTKQMNCTANLYDTSFTSCPTAMPADRPEYLAWTDDFNPLKG